MHLLILHTNSNVQVKTSYNNYYQYIGRVRISYSHSGRIRSEIVRKWTFAPSHLSTAGHVQVMDMSSVSKTRALMSTTADILCFYLHLYS